MADRPLIFAMANPDPEIRYELAKEARPDAIVATGRSDYPNQINNVLGFPFIFRGALDVRARAINDEMKVAASHALADLARQDVPDSVLHAYGIDRLKFGTDYIIPKPFDPRVLLWEAPAVAKAAMESGAARLEIDIDNYRNELALRQGKGERVRQFIINRARQAPKRIVFGEGEETKIIRAAARVKEEGIGTPVLLGRPDVIGQRIQELGLELEVEVVDPAHDERAEAYTEQYFELRRRKGMTRARAGRHMLLPNVFGPMMVHAGDADAYIAGLTYDYPEVIRPALQILHTRQSSHLVAGVYIMIVEDKVYLFSDATVNIDPSADDLAEIAMLVAEYARQLELEPRVAMLSFSNFGSTRHPLSDKVRQAVAILRERAPELAVDGEMQADTAVVEELIAERYPFSRVRDANILIFPSLESANVAYKLLDRLSDARAIGPILLGTGAPIHVLQTGDDVEDIVHVAAVAAMDAGNRG
jgi:malate dehydrogenase (oxaloacetate-decarboxylating)(NADP+)